LKQELDKHSLTELEGREFYAEYDCVTDPMTSEKPNRVSHVAYGYATHVVILDREGRIQKVVAAHDVGKAINPNGVEGQIEGGVVMGLGYALTEKFSVRNGAPAVTLGTLDCCARHRSRRLSVILSRRTPPLWPMGRRVWEKL